MTTASGKQYLRCLLCALAGALAFLSVPFFLSESRLGSFGILSVMAVAGYLYIVLAVADRNWLDIRAVFHGAWMITIALSQLRLVDYQEVWLRKTWYLVTAAYVLFELGATLGMQLGDRAAKKLYQRKDRFHIGRVYFRLQENRLFWLCVGTTLVGLACFLINIRIKGFIPAFSESSSAYRDFYTKFHVFAVAAISISGLCYYCIRTQKLSWVRKLILWLCILYSTFVFPILVVSRGVFVVSAVSLTVAVFYLGKRRFLTLVLCLAVILGVYVGTSALRNLTDSQLSTLFPSSEIVLDNKKNDGLKDDGEIGEDHFEDGEITSFALSPKMAFLYSYLTVSHDNFNVAVRETVGYSYGARALAPFNVILRNEWIADENENGEYHLVRPYLTTNNLIGEAYYDFHEWGVILFAIFWSVVFGMIQQFYLVWKGPFSLLFLGNTMVPVALCFFASWMGNFTHWMLWGVVLIYALIACATTKKKPEE